ncbi:UNVERIFIED_CONTAM: hypothetical protein FKN15_020505 [Acipenser sinensis]
MPNSVQKVQLLVDKRVSGMDDTFEMLKCDEDLPSSPGYPSSENRMEYDDLPELQAVQEDIASPEVFQLSAGVSHQEHPRSIWNPHTSSSSDNAGSPSNGTNWLTELANIATSPQSPLMQCTFYNRSSPVHIIATSKSLHSYARPPPSTSNSEPRVSETRWKERAVVKHERANSESESGIFCMSSLSDDDDLGTRLRFHKGHNIEWQDAEDLADSEDERHPQNHYINKSYGSDGLKLVAHEETVSFGQSVLKLTFDPGSPEDGALTAECSLDHPFFVKSKGWSSFYPSLTVVQHGIPCYEMQVGDTCLPPGHPSAINFDDSVVFDTFRRAISVILGDRWKKMKNEERRMYTMEAKALAEEQKRLNPDCWKRKRTNSGSQQN